MRNLQKAMTAERFVGGERAVLAALAAA